ncbi:hypothetical protein COCSADRAFT_37826 [Bipolaris sorokiniana ND90Pr]|uniref:Uncharacterized protein n=1 Tax=Cochliobolus sativus (strain ND90Pr / ATCC 201652) TaxID=665912 RepID=M2T1N9_COCSN|nr:uncharacterized protein COCSADRAFT_37826 [Bipolaris sorokiniana ND90Pr]EMD62942.1 hypothetical protein COCSADRAFT_37826 [Bipolaris sorokiniana ND90Pr]
MFTKPPLLLSASFSRSPQTLFHRANPHLALLSLLQSYLAHPSFPPLHPYLPHPHPFPTKNTTLKTPPALTLAPNTTYAYAYGHPCAIPTLPRPMLNASLPSSAHTVSSGFSPFRALKERDGKT